MVTEGERISTADRLARIEENIRHMTDTLKGLAEEVRESNKCVGSLGDRLTKAETTQATHADEIKALRQRDNNGTIANAILAVIAGAIGIFKP